MRTPSWTGGVHQAETVNFMTCLFVQKVNSQKKSERGLGEEYENALPWSLMDPRSKCPKRTSVYARGTKPFSDRSNNDGTLVCVFIIVTMTTKLP